MGSTGVPIMQKRTHLPDDYCRNILMEIRECWDACDTALRASGQGSHQLEGARKGSSPAMLPWLAGIAPWLEAAVDLPPAQPCTPVTNRSDQH